MRKVESSVVNPLVESQPPVADAPGSPAPTWSGMVWGAHHRGDNCSWRAFTFWTGTNLKEQVCLLSSGFRGLVSARASAAKAESFFNVLTLSKT